MLYAAIATLESERRRIVRRKLVVGAMAD